MRRWAKGTWITPTVVIGQAVGLGFDPEWIRAQLGRWTHGACSGGPLTQQRRIGTRNGMVERLARARLTLREDDIRKAILKRFAENGRAPSVSEVAQALDLPAEGVLTGLRTLAAHDLLIWAEDETRIVSAYPFSGVPTAHQVFIDGDRPLYAMCAIDALGIPFLLGRGARIRSACFFCGTPVIVEVHEGALTRADLPSAVVWLSEREGCCVAEARCPLINFFCHASHLEAWLAASPDERGRGLSMLEALEVGKATFGELLR
ncbi:MAG TPA: organomercurial lyase [Alphaproteobacteria bacterium]|nr:organomercurial lyase [Alphaproteobacteria bacterium]